MKEVYLESWGIFPSNSSSKNTANFNLFFNKEVLKNQHQKFRLIFGSGIFNFDLLDIGSSETFLNGLSVEGKGIGETIIKFSANEHTCLLAHHLTNFNISDLSIDGSKAKFEGGLWIRTNCTFGKIERVEIFSANDVSLVISGPQTSHIVVRDCQVYSQRNFTGNSKAMFLAGDDAEFVTFDNCLSFSKSKDESFYSIADHFDTDNARFVKYYNCYANGEGSKGGVGFWNEGEGEGLKSTSFYYGCTAYKTHGGLANTENSKVQAYGMNFIECSSFGWTVWSKGNYPLGSLSLTGGFFKKCGSDRLNLKYGGIHIEANTYITDCTFEDTPVNSFNISFYKFGAGLPFDTFAIISGCNFDKGIQVHCPYANDGPSVKNINIDNCIFKPDALFSAIENPVHYRIKLSGCTFFGQGIILENINNIKILGNTFYAGEDRESAPIALRNNVHGILQDNLFSDFNKENSLLKSENKNHGLKVYFNDYE